MAGLTLRGVRKTYDNGFTAIHGIDLDVADGTFAVLVGPSGCGKSTLLRMVAGLESISAGELRIGDRVVNRLEPKDRDIAMVFQNYALYPHMKVFDNMAYGLKIAGVPRLEIRDRVAKAAAMLGLAELLDRKPRQLSGGQRQRVAMGRAIVREPAVFLFDEPLSNLDAKLRVQMRLEIRKLHETLRTTSLYVTHDQVEAMTLGEVLVVMNGGVAEQIDTPLAIYERPASLFVAGFIGSPAMNLLPGVVTTDGVDLGGLTVPTGGDTQAVGRSVTLGIRPEHVVIDTNSDSSFPLTVRFAEQLGADTIVHGRLAGATPDLTVRMPGGQPVAAGDILPIVMPIPSLHLFDTVSGLRIEAPAALAA